jgi:hypothetical protein
VLLHWNCNALQTSKHIMGNHLEWLPGSLTAPVQETQCTVFTNLALKRIVVNDDMYFFKCTMKQCPLDYNNRTHIRLSECRIVGHEPIVLYFTFR